MSNKPPVPTAHQLRTIKARAKKKNIPFNLEPSDLPIPPRCPACTSTFTADNRPSVDRLIPNLGYTKGNVAILCERCNRIKNDALPPQLRGIANWVEAQAAKKNTKQRKEDSENDSPS